MHARQGDDERASALEPVDVSRRKVVKVALAASAVAVPVISSVALGGVSPAFAESPNISGQTTTAGTTPVPSSTTAGPTEAPTTVSPTTTTTPVTTTTTTVAPPPTTTQTPTTTLRPTEPT